MNKLLEVKTEWNIKEDVFIPHEIVQDILSHLPVKSLMRFKSVCKLWYETISHKDFIRSNNTNKPKYILRSPSKASVDFIFLNPQEGRITPCKWQRTSDNNTKSSFSENKTCEVLYDEVIVDSCNALLLVVADDIFYMWNPVSRFLVKVLENLPLYDKEFRSLRCYYYVIGFCHDSWRDEYKVLVMVSWQDYDRNSSPLILVAGLKEKRWKEIRSPLNHHQAPDNFIGKINFHGMLHWVFRYFTKCPMMREMQVLMCYKAETDEFKELSIPEQVENRTETKYLPVKIVGLGSIGGRLAVLVLHIDIGSLEMMSMNEYGVKDSWTSMFVLSGIMEDNWFLSYLECGLLKLMINGEILVIVGPLLGDIYIYNQNSETRNKINRDNWNGGSLSIRVVEYAETLVSPTGYASTRQHHHGNSKFENIDFLQRPNNKFIIN